MKELMKAETLDIVRQMITDGQVSQEVAEKYFPELKESKNKEDERLRKTTIAFLEDLAEQGYENAVECIDWLIKQGDQKYADKVEPKFKVGDWIVFNGLTLYIKEVVKGYYRTISRGGITNSYDWDIDNVARLWTIQDAKDGDVLCCESGWTCIFKTLVNDETFSSYCFMDNTKWFCETGSECHTLNKEFMKVYNGEIKPATKEQRDLLFKKMHEAGYEWDAEQKQLKKIEQKPNNNQFTPEQASVLDKHIDKFVEQKSAWSEEDDKYRLYLIEYLEGKTKWETLKGRAIDWLKSLKGRVGCEVNCTTAWKPSKKQMEILQYLCETSSHPNEKVIPTLESLYQDLKKLREE